VEQDKIKARSLDRTNLGSSGTDKQQGREGVKDRNENPDDNRDEDDDTDKQDDSNEQALLGKNIFLMSFENMLLIQIIMHILYLLKLSTFLFAEKSHRINHDNMLIVSMLLNCIFIYKNFITFGPNRSNIFFDFHFSKWSTQIV